MTTGRRQQSRTTRHLIAASIALAVAGVTVSPAPVHAQQAVVDDAIDIMTMLSDEAALFPAMRSIWETTARDRADLSDLYARDPAIVDFMWVYMEPELKAIYSRAIPGARQAGATALRKYLTPSEIKTVAAFYRTETGRRIRALSVQTLSFPAADRDRLYAEEMRKIIASVPAGDRALVLASGPAIAKLDAGYTEVTGAVRAEMERAMAAEEPRLREVATRAAKDYLARKAKTNG